MNRIDRLTAILIHLQSKRIVKAEELANRFEISLRTVYRDVKALMEAGVPIGSEAGTGYFIVDGYHLPPVMFSQEEAGAMLLAGKLVEKMTDRSVREAFESALTKIKSVLNDPGREHLENLYTHIEVQRSPRGGEPEFPNRFLTDIQTAVVVKKAIEIEYLSRYRDQLTQRIVEPIGLYYYGSAWHLIAWCRFRNDYRDFRADRISKLTLTTDTFSDHNLLSLQEYAQSVMRSHGDVDEAIVRFDKRTARHIGERKYGYGFVAEEDLGDAVRMTFLTGFLPSLGRWLLSYGSAVEIESPEKLREIVHDLLGELNDHYKPALAPTN
ncbi:MAG TPA: YafY family protein [Cyclobacteriaceae bacterium]|jgi:predicted DNA-binding transcriptional regulator YafY